MEKSVKVPSKEEVRAYLQRRVVAHKPPPSMEQIRRELGWGLTGMSRRTPGAK